MSLSVAPKRQNFRRKAPSVGRPELPLSSSSTPCVSQHGQGGIQLHSNASTYNVLASDDRSTAQAEYRDGKHTRRQFICSTCVWGSVLRAAVLSRREM